MANRQFLYVNADFEYQPAAESVTSSTGSGDSGKLITLDGAGKIDFSLIPDAVKNNLQWKESVRVASPANVTIATAPASIDGVTLTNGDRVLLFSQTNPVENGIYVFNGVGSAMSRAADADSDAEVKAGLSLISNEGNTCADKWWILTTNDPIVLGTSALTFTPQNTTNLQEGDGIDLTGGIASVDIKDADSGLAFDSGELLVDFADPTVTSDLDGTNGKKLIAIEDLYGFGANKGLNLIGGDSSNIPQSSATTAQAILEDIAAAIDAGQQNGINYTAAAGGLNAGDLVYISGNDVASKLPITGAASANYGIGLVLETVAGAAQAEVLANDTVIEGVLTALSPTAGQRVFWDGSALTLTPSTTGNSNIWIVGYARNADDLHVEIRNVRRNAV